MRRASVVLVFVLLAAGCALSSDESAAVIDQGSLDETLQRVTTTTTSTTLAAQTQDVAFFLLTEATENIPRQVQQVSWPVPSSDDPIALLAPMFEDDFKTTVGLPDLINRVTDFMLLAVEVDGDIATVFLEPRADIAVENITLKDVAAQLVWTISGLGIDKILINLDEELVTLETTDGNTSDPVGIAEYDAYNPEIEIPTEPEDPGTSSTTTTVAPASGGG